MSPSHTPASGYWTSKSTVQIWYAHVANYLRQDPASAGKLPHRSMKGSSAVQSFDAKYEPERIGLFDRINM